MTLNAAWKLDRGDDARIEISLIKFFGARVLHDVIDRAIQIHGALGYSKDTPLEMFYRDARAARRPVRRTRHGVVSSWLLTAVAVGLMFALCH